SVTGGSLVLFYASMKTFLHIVAIALIPCLLADSAVAFGTPLRVCFPPDIIARFSEEALILRLMAQRTASKETPRAKICETAPIERQAIGQLKKLQKDRGRISWKLLIS